MLHYVNHCTCIHGLLRLLLHARNCAVTAQLVTQLIKSPRELELTSMMYANAMANTTGSLPLQSLDERLAALERGAAAADLAAATMRHRDEMSAMLDRFAAMESQVTLYQCFHRRSPLLAEGQPCCRLAVIPRGSSGTSQKDGQGCPW